MQPWQSVLLIFITLIIFGAGLYYDQIKKNTAIAYEDSLITTPSELAEDMELNDSLEINTSAILENSSAWAEKKVHLEVPKSNSRFSHLHKEAIKGDQFLVAIIKSLQDNPNAKKLIFSPFLNDVFIESETTILRSLYSIAQDVESPNRLVLTVRGHSVKASSLLTRVITESYAKELNEESPGNPLLPKLAKQRREISMLEQSQLQLAKQIQEENENSPGQSIEEIALLAELSQVKNDIQSGVKALKEIENIHLAQKDSSEYLTIKMLADFGNVQDFFSNIVELKKLLAKQELEAILKKEVNKNLDKLESSLAQEIARGIDHIKRTSRVSLDRKIELQRILVDLEMKKNDIHSLHPRFRVLKSVKKQLDEKNALFSSEFKKWQIAKQNLVIRKST